MLLHRNSQFLLVGTVLAMSISAGSAQDINNKGETFPAIRLPSQAKASAIIQALGSKLPDVARWYGVTEFDLRQVCLRDKNIRADKSGRLFYACEGHMPKANPTVGRAGTVDGSGIIAAGPFALTDTFLLHSKPGASRVIYLDFNGHTTTGTPWNTNYTAGASFATPAYDTDGNPAAFSTNELNAIQEVFQRVAEDFLPWDVDVTTQDPGLESLRKTSSTDTAYGVRVVIGGSSSQWLGASAGGVGYIGSFSWSTDTPCYVFEEQLGNGYPKYVAEAASHEVGHTLGLNHDGTTTGSEYYEGHANWAPIMGVGYSKDVVQWSKGEYPNANNTQDDATIINGHIPRRLDQVGDVIVNATMLTGTSPQVGGILETSADNDLFGFSTGAGTIRFTAAVAKPSANLDVKLSLYDGSGNLLNSSDATGLAGDLTATVPAGTYYLGVDGTNLGTGSTGYSDYGSLGQFLLSGNLLPLGNQPPVAVASVSSTSGTAPLSVTFSSAGSSDPEGSTLTYDWDFGDGTSAIIANPAKTYSTQGNYTASLVVYDSAGIASLPSSVSISVNQPTVAMFVADITMSLSSNNQGYQATGRVTVKDASGAVVPNAIISANWTGLSVVAATATTNSSGVATFLSKRVKKRGTFTLAVNNVSASGKTYTPSVNVKTSASISTP